MMKLVKVVLFVALVCSVAIIGCGDDEEATGGTGGTDTCTIGSCADSSADVQGSCQTAVTFCNSDDCCEVPGAGGAGGTMSVDPDSDDCDAVGQFVCEILDAGAGGTGGTGGDGDGLFCDEDACANSELIEGWCQTGVLLCGEAPNEEECIAIVNAWFCEFSVSQVFVTSEDWNGNLEGLSGGDTKCNSAAADAGLDGTWTAWLSDSGANADAIDRIPDREYRLLDEDDTVVANDKADLTDGTLDAAINRDEKGGTVTTDTSEPDAAVWTGTASGGISMGFNSCIGWTVNTTTESGRIGDATRTTGGWTDQGGQQSCDTTNRLYCFLNP